MNLKGGKMRVEEIEYDLNRGIYLNNYSNVEQAISFLLSEVKRLREGISEVMDGTLPYLAEKRLKELLEDK